MKNYRNPTFYMIKEIQSNSDGPFDVRGSASKEEKERHQNSSRYKRSLLLVRSVKIELLLALTRRIKCGKMTKSKARTAHFDMPKSIRLV